MSRFAITRADGRSNAQVVIDLVKDVAPGTVFAFADLRAALERDTPTTYRVPAVRAAVLAAAPRLLREYQRTLHSLRAIGYRLAHADDHMRLALVRKRRSDVQMHWGFSLLKHVRWGEMDPNLRLAHEGTFVLISHQQAQARAFDARLREVERAIEKLKK